MQQCATCFQEISKEIQSQLRKDIPQVKLYVWVWDYGFYFFFIFLLRKLKFSRYFWGPLNCAMQRGMYVTHSLKYYLISNCLNSLQF